MNIVVTVEEVKNHLGIDYDDAQTSANIERLIRVADAYLAGSIGEDYPREDERAREIALLVIADLYENRGTRESVSTMTRRLVDDMSMQMRMEMRRGMYG